MARERKSCTMTQPLLTGTICSQRHAVYLCGRACVCACFIKTLQYGHTVLKRNSSCCFLMVPWQPVHELLSILAHLPDMWICSSAADRFPKCWEALRSLCKIQQLCLFTREENHTFIHRANTVPPFLLLMAYFCRQHDVFNRLSTGLLDNFLSKACC